MCLSFHKALGLKQASKLNLTDHLAEASNQFLPRSNLIHHGLKYADPTILTDVRYFVADSSSPAKHTFEEL